MGELKLEESTRRKYYLNRRQGNGNYKNANKREKAKTEEQKD